jgi:hypothetical protein
LVPGQEEYAITTDFQIIPKKQSGLANVQTTHMDGSYDEQDWADIYPMNGENIQITLNRVENRNGFKRIKTIPLKKTQKILMKFSKSGKFFAILNIDSCLLSVYDSSDIMECFNSIKRERPVFKIKLGETFEAKKLVFDIRDKYLSVNSETEIQIYSLR